MNRLPLIMLIFISYSSVSATIINVPADSSTIQGGINGSSNGDTVLVQPGTYVENINFNGHNIVLGSLFLMTGDTSYISTTIIDGDSSGSVVIFESGEDSTTVITGFTIQNGFAHSGAGVFCDSSSPVISNNIISENSTYLNGINDGGGIYCNNYSSPLIINNIVKWNVAGHTGAGIYSFMDCSPIINNNIIQGNYCEYGAGGIFCSNGYPIISYNTIIENYGMSGSGIGVYNAAPTIDHNTIIGNSDGPSVYIRFDYGPSIFSNNLVYENNGFYGAIYISRNSSFIIDNNVISENVGYGITCYDDCSPAINNNIISGNSAYGIGCFDNSFPSVNNNTLFENSGNGIRCQTYSSPSILNNIIWGNGGSQVNILDTLSFPTITYCNIQDTLWPGQGNISCDPLFCYPDTANYYLNLSSCCLGAGQNGEDIGAKGVGCWNCEGYVIGDINDSGDYNGLDVTYGVSYLKGGPPPPYECVCTPGNIWYASGDVNGSCSYNGLDVTYGVAYFKGGSDPVPCPDCPPVR